MPNVLKTSFRDWPYEWSRVSSIDASKSLFTREQTRIYAVIA